MKNILILSFYCTPDVGPGALRGHSILNALSNHHDKNLQITLLTTMPNRYAESSIVAPEYEKIGRASIYRVKLPRQQGGMLGQIKNFLYYFLFVYQMTKNRKWDIVVATSSRLMTASLGAYVAKKSEAKLYLDIRDLFVDAIIDVLPKWIGFFILPPLKILESWTLRSCSEVNIISAGFLPYIKKIITNQKISVYTNGIDPEFVSVKSPSRNFNKLPVVLYAGNIGDGQGLHHIIPEIAKEMEGRCLFRVIGAGGRKAHLMHLLKYMEIKNVEVIDPVNRQNLINYYEDADILFLHLNLLRAFDKVLPSEIFEYAAMMKPIVAGVSGYAAEFIEAEIPDAKVFKPCDVLGMKVCLEDVLNMKLKIDRADFFEKYSRVRIVEKMATRIISLAK